MNRSENRFHWRSVVFWTLYAALLLLPAAFEPLLETTEGRYAEIAREMVASGNYLEPRLNGILHFHKPPLAYWLMAAGMKLFGADNFGVRFFSIAAAGLAVFFLYRLARLLLDRRAAFGAALIFASSGLFLAVCRLVSTDIYLTCFVLWAQYFLFRQIRGFRSPWNVVGLASGLGLGFLTKGPVILLFTLLPFIATKLFSQDHRRVFSWKETFFGSAVFSLIALPWYLIVLHRHPNLWYFFLEVQTVERLSSDRFHRSGPFWYFIYVFVAGLLPYSFFLLKGIFRWRKLQPGVRSLGLYLLIPFLVFSLSHSKLATYILPFFGTASIMAASALHTLAMPRLKILALVVGALAALALGGAGFFYAPVAPVRFYLAGIGIVAMSLVWSAYRRRTSEWYPMALAGCIMLISASVTGFMSVAGPQLKSYEKMLAKVNAIDPVKAFPVLIYRDFIPSVSFYRDAIAVMAVTEDRDLQFETDETYRSHFLATQDELTAYLADREAIFLVIRPAYLPLFQAKSGYQCRAVFSQRKHTAYACRKAFDKSFG